MITLIDFVKNISYTNIENKLEITLYNKNYEENNQEEFVNIPVTIYNILKYGDYAVTDIGANYKDKKGSYLDILIQKEAMFY